MVGHESEDFHLTDVDRLVLSQDDENFRLHDWDELKEIIGQQRVCSLSNPFLTFPLGSLPFELTRSYSLSSPSSSFFKSIARDKDEILRYLTCF